MITNVTYLCFISILLTSCFISDIVGSDKEDVNYGVPV